MAERCTQSRIPLKPVYRPGDLDGSSPAERLGNPGAFPHTRGATQTLALAGAQAVEVANIERLARGRRNH